jgi:hypothetical protein
LSDLADSETLIKAAQSRHIEKSSADPEGNRVGGDRVTDRGGDHHSAGECCCLCDEQHPQSASLPGGEAAKKVAASERGGNQQTDQDRHAR